MANLRILTADEVVKKVKQHQAMTATEKREFALKREQLEAYHDLRDDLCSIVLNSGKNFERIHAEGGSTVKTIQNWMDKRVSQPRLGKMRATLKICGYNLGIVDKNGNAVLTKRAR